MDIVPVTYINIARYLNRVIKRKDANVIGRMVQVDKEVTLLLLAEKVIQEGDELRWYSGDNYQTDNFVLG